MITLYIARHGETDYNKQGRYLGRADISLNSAGVQQVKKLAKRIGILPVDAVISSPLKRARETASIIFPNCRIIINRCFIERSLGIYERLTKREVKDKYPDLYKKGITRIFNQAPPGGETIEQVQRRVYQGIGDIKEKYPGKNILIITHSFIAKVIHRYFNPDLADSDFFSFILPSGELRSYLLNR